MEHPQIVAIMKNIRKGYRNTSFYALSKACLGDGLKLDNAISLLLDINADLARPEPNKKVETTVIRAFNDGLGLSPEKVCATAVALTDKKFKTDNNIKKMFNKYNDYNPKTTNKTRNNLKKHQSIKRSIKAILSCIRKGYNKLPSQKRTSKCCWCISI